MTALANEHNSEERGVVLKETGNWHLQGLLWLLGQGLLCTGLDSTKPIRGWLLCRVTAGHAGLRDQIPVQTNVARPQEMLGTFRSNPGKATP